jgi:hypothetical protein
MYWIRNRYDTYEWIIHLFNKLVLKVKGRIRIKNARKQYLNLKYLTISIIRILGIL